MERVIIDEPVRPPDFLGDSDGALMDAPGNLRIERPALEGMTKDRLCIGSLLEIQVIRARFDAHTDSIADVLESLIYQQTCRVTPIGIVYTLGDCTIKDERFGLFTGPSFGRRVCAW